MAEVQVVTKVTLMLAVVLAAGPAAAAAGVALAELAASPAAVSPSPLSCLLSSVPCVTRHLPLTISMDVSEWLRMIARSPHLSAAGHKMQALAQHECATAMVSRSERNPRLVFRETLSRGLGGIAGHGHSAATAAMAGAVPEIHRLVQPPLPYDRADVDAMVEFVLAHG